MCCVVGTECQCADEIEALKNSVSSLESALQQQNTALIQSIEEQSSLTDALLQQITALVEQQNNLTTYIEHEVVTTTDMQDLGEAIIVALQNAMATVTGGEHNFAPVPQTYHPLFSYVLTAALMIACAHLL